MSERMDLKAAEAEFDRFADAMDLELDPAIMSDEDKESLSESRSRVIKAFRNGSLVLSDACEPVFTPQRSENVEAITFYEPTGASLMAMDKKKKNADISKTYALMGEVTKTTPKTFSAMKMGDLKVCMALIGLFIG